MSYNFDPIYLIYLLVAASAGLAVEGVYLLCFNDASYRKNVNRPVEESLAYARQQRAGRALVIGEPSAPAGQVRVISLDGSGEGWVPIAEILADPARHFPGVGGAHHA